MAERRTIKTYATSIMTTIRARRGFTLIELMVVVAIVAILAAIAYPSYVQYIIRSNRAAAESFMLEVTSFEQRFLLDNRAYTTTLGTGGLGMTVPTTVAANYTVTVTTPTPTSFTITAAPIAGTSQANNDTACATLAIDNTGVKYYKTTLSDTAGVSACWRQ